MPLTAQVSARPFLLDTEWQSSVRVFPLPWPIRRRTRSPVDRPSSQLGGYELLGVFGHPLPNRLNEPQGRLLLRGILA